MSGNTHWTDDDTTILLAGVRQHMPRKNIAKLLGRTTRAVEMRLHTCHHDEWARSGHPESKTRPANSQDHNTMLKLYAELERRVERLEALVLPGAESDNGER